MCAFGASANAASASAEGALQALAAAVAIWDGLGRLSAELAHDLDEPFAFGIGLHGGIATVGSLQVQGPARLRFLGDTGNVAARLEAMTKELDCTAIVSESVLRAAGADPGDALSWRELALRGREALPLRVALVRAPEEIAALLAAPVLAPA